VAWHYTEMGRLVADAGKRDWDELTAEYGAMLMEGLGVNHLSSEDNACLRQVGAPGSRRGLPAGAAHQQLNVVIE
jgi:uncharacterized protein YbgA (DUF1722 family)